MSEEAGVPKPRICANCKFWSFEGPSWEESTQGVCGRITTLHTRSPAEVRGSSGTELVTEREFGCSLFVEITPSGL